MLGLRDLLSLLTVEDCLTHVLLNLDPRLSSQVSAVIWFLWNNRNSFLWKAQRSDAPAIHDWTYAQSLKVLPQAPLPGLLMPPAVVQTHHWYPPPLGSLKCNIDSSIFALEHSCGFGAVIRSSQALFHIAVSGHYPGLRSSRKAEACGLRKLLLWPSSQQYHSVLIEIDSLQVFNDVSHEADLCTEYGRVVNDCVSLPKQNPQFSLHWIRR
ncbi:hypothetical protein P3X46_009377 [Hevea brasiliensis]|uniref:RNase H type-1 domain-containing protein n=1 Tax=Hevea brasiliensis TaxID=3981 RepID=A0ABQ9MQI2_HEVBR|nr:hypothetical protein P3X46_009377 [Hevea brasiliensis]